MNLAARGSRQISSQVERIEDEAELAQVKKQARSVWVKSLLAGTAVFLLALFLF